MSWRKQGALAFAHVQDQTGKLQLFLRRNLVQPTDAADGRLGYAETNLLDIGDIIEATGKVVRTERGEISVLVETLRLLTKAIRPLPDQWSGLKDREQVLRKRYLDTTLEPESFERFGAISKMVAAIRAFLNERGFMEFHDADHPAAIRRRHGQAVQDARQRAGLRNVSGHFARALFEAPDCGRLTTRFLPLAAISATKASTAAIIRSSRWSKPWRPTRITNTT